MCGFVVCEMIGQPALHLHQQASCVLGSVANFNSLSEYAFTVRLTGGTAQTKTKPISK